MSVAKTDHEDTTVYKVVVNHEEQYSIWPEWREMPNGWTEIGFTGQKTACLEYIESVWTDMRPLSLRRAMEQANTTLELAPVPETGSLTEESLPVRLSRGDHPVELILRPELTVEGLARQVKTGYVHVKFTGTRGGTELAVALEPAAVDSINAKIGLGEGKVHVVGGLTLDYTPVRCVANIDLATFAGTGRLEILPE